MEKDLFKNLPHLPGAPADGMEDPASLLCAGAIAKCRALEALLPAADILACRVQTETFLLASAAKDTQAKRHATAAALFRAVVLLSPPSGGGARGWGGKGEDGEAAAWAAQKLLLRNSSGGGAAVAAALRAREEFAWSVGEAGSSSGGSVACSLLLC